VANSTQAVVSFFVFRDFRGQIEVLRLIPSSREMAGRLFPAGLHCNRRFPVHLFKAPRKGHNARLHKNNDKTKGKAK
jgi:hypothetical protein